MDENDKPDQIVEQLLNVAVELKKLERGELAIVCEFAAGIVLGQASRIRNLEERNKLLANKAARNEAGY